MKKIVSILLLAATMLATCACHKEDQPGGGKVSDLQYLIDGLMQTDKNGNITGYMVGDNLNPANPYDISVPVDSYEEAVVLFLSLLPPDAIVSQGLTSVTWDMTDGDGKPECKAVLKKNELLGAVATLTVTPQLLTKGAKDYPSVTFLPPILWPENGGAAEEILNRDYYVGAAVNKTKDDGFGTGEYLVIREWTPQEAGIMIKMDNKKCDGIPGWGISSLNTLHKVHRALMANYQLLVEGYGKAKGWPSLNNWYISKTDTWYGDQGYLNLQTGKEDWVWMGKNSAYVVYVYLFRPDGDKIKFW